MSLEAMKDISEAEEKAKTIRAEAAADVKRMLAEAEAAQKAAEAAPAAGEGKAAAPKKRVRPRRPVPDGKSVIGAFRRMFDNEHEV